MRKLEYGAIDRALSSLEQAIEKRKIQMRNTRGQSGFLPIVPHLYSEIFNRAGGYYAQVANRLGHGKEFAQGFLDKILQSAKKEPWEFVRNVAVYSFAAGLFFSRCHKRSPAGEKE